MKPFVVLKQPSRLKGEISLLGDKSIAHRSVIISALSHGITRIENFPANKDCLSTVKAFKKLGIKITRQSSGVITVFGKGLWGLKKPKGPIFVGDSGTTLRLLLGVLAGQDFKTKLIAGKSLSQRPMLRVIQPLRLMGAHVQAQYAIRKAQYEEYPPITIKGGNLRHINYRMPVASAQVKSAILLAALYVKGKTKIQEPVVTRDHTERMLKLFRADIKVQRNTIVIKRNRNLASPGIINIPGDISSAAFFLVLASIIPNSEVLIRNISLNPSRLGIIKVLKRMRANINIKYQISNIKNSEPAGNIIVKSSKLKGAIVRKKEIPSLIDELPILMVAASGAGGRTILEGVSELRVKETDRLRSMSCGLRKMGAKIKVLKVKGREDIIIQGKKQLKGAKVRSFGDHRTAMSMIVAGFSAIGRTRIDDISCINKSFPEFLRVLYSLIH